MDTRLVHGSGYVGRRQPRYGFGSEQRRVISEAGARLREGCCPNSSPESRIDARSR